VDGVAEAHDLAQKVGSMAEALKDAGHLLASRFCPPLVIDLCHLTGSIGILDQVDLFRGFRHEFLEMFFLAGSKVAQRVRIALHRKADLFLFQRREYTASYLRPITALHGDLWSFCTDSSPAESLIKIVIPCVEEKER
jgi:hypothetical protein